MGFPKPELTWEKDDKRSFTTYKIRLEGGTLTAFYNPLESSYHLSFFSHDQSNFGVAVYNQHVGIKTHGKAKSILLPYLDKVKAIPGYPSNLSSGLEKLVEKLKGTLE